MKKLWKLVKALLLVLLCTGIIVAGVLTYQGYQIYKEAKAQTSLADKVNEIRNRENYIPISQVSKYYLDAVVAVEDHRFYDHHGFDIIATGRALWEDIKAMSFVQGGSTITQQLAKNLYFTQEKEVTRKIAELFMAFELEKNYSKEEILELYINIIFFGDGYTGVKEAANGIIGCSPADLDLGQAALLAGLPKSPTSYSKDPQKALARRDNVVAAMVKFGRLSKEEAEALGQSGSLPPSFKAQSAA